MAAGTAIGKIGKIDFFSCLPSGAYAFLCLYLAFSIVFSLGVDSEKVLDGGNATATVSVKLIIDETNNLITKTSLEPTSLLLLIFFAYLLGSIFRAFPVSNAEFFYKCQKSEFPYEIRILELIDQIHEYANTSPNIKAELSLLKNQINLANDQEKKEGKENLLAVYNYWKDVLCTNSPEAFLYYQEFEARTRFFSSMIFSGLISGSLVTASGLLLWIFYPNLPSWSYYSLFILSLASFIIFFIFRQYITHIRTQELQTLTGLYLSYIQSVKS